MFLKKKKLKMPLNFSKSHKQTHPFAHNPPKNTLLPQNLLKITRLPPKHL